MKLTPKQQLFVKEYLVDLNATQAAIRAGYSFKTAEQLGYQQLQKASVQEAIQAAMDKRAEKVEITADSVLQEIAKLAFANPQDYYDLNGNPKQIHELTRDQAAAINSVRVNMTMECAVVETKLHDKKSSLELLGRHLKLFTDKQELTGSGGGAIKQEWTVKIVDC